MAQRNFKQFGGHIFGIKLVRTSFCKKSKICPFYSVQNSAVLEEVTRKYIETFNGGKEADDKCSKCSAFNKHYHCLAEGCKMAHR